MTYQAEMALPVNTIAAAEREQPEGAAHARIQDLLPRGEGEQRQHAQVERHERHVADQVARRRAAPVALLPHQVEHGVERGGERDGADGETGDLRWSAHGAPGAKMTDGLGEQ